MRTSLVAIDHEFDEQTLDEFEQLRAIRLALAEKQFMNADATIDELIRRNLIPSDCDREEYLLELKTELAAKIARLRERDSGDGLIHSDEIELYVGVLR